MPVIPGPNVLKLDERFPFGDDRGTEGRAGQILFDPFAGPFGRLLSPLAAVTDRDRGYRIAIPRRVIGPKARHPTNQFGHFLGALLHGISEGACVGPGPHNEIHRGSSSFRAHRRSSSMNAGLEGPACPPT